MRRCTTFLHPRRGQRKTLKPRPEALHLRHCRTSTSPGILLHSALSPRPTAPATAASTFAVFLGFALSELLLPRFFAGLLTRRASKRAHNHKSHVTRSDRRHKDKRIDKDIPNRCSDETRANRSKQTHTSAQTQAAPMRTNTHSHIRHTDTCTIQSHI